MLNFYIVNLISPWRTLRIFRNFFFMTLLPVSKNSLQAPDSSPFSDGASDNIFVWHQNTMLPRLFSVFKIIVTTVGLHEEKLGRCVPHPIFGLLWPGT